MKIDKLIKTIGYRTALDHKNQIETKLSEHLLTADVIFSDGVVSYSLLDLNKEKMVYLQNIIKLTIQHMEEVNEAE